MFPIDTDSHQWPTQQGKISFAPMLIAKSQRNNNTESEWTRAQQQMFDIKVGTDNGNDPISCEHHILVIMSLHDAQSC